jgi:hypothetical protein
VLSFLINISPWLRSYQCGINDNVSEVCIEIWELDCDVSKMPRMF